MLYVDALTGRSYTFAQVKEVATTFAHGLRSVWDWKKNDVLALFTPNSIDVPPVIWGCHWAGGIVTTANPAYTVAELTFQLKDAGAKAIVTQLPLLGTALGAARAVGIPEDMVIVIGDERDKTGRVKHFTSIRKVAGTDRYRRVKRTPSDLAFLAYSSGTTGLPKGVMLSHGNIVSNVNMLMSGEEQHLTWNGNADGKGDRILGFLPFFHIYGLTCLLHQCVMVGWTLVVLPRFDIETFCRLVQQYRITFAYVVPPVVLQLAKHPVVEKYDLSSLRMMNSGAAPLTRELTEQLYSRIKVPVKQGYGLSETSPTTHTQPWAQWRDTMGSVGRMLPNQTAKYMSEDEKEVPIGQVGELWIKGPNIFKGYLNNPEGTKNALTLDGYFKTGDVGYQDKDGNFYITDRVKELIKYKGFQVPPAELEGLLISHPKVNDVAVVGIHDDAQATEVPRAFVVPEKGVEGSTQTAKELTEWLGQQVASHKRLRGGIKFVDEIPKSASGKILRRVLKKTIEEEAKRGQKAKL